MESTSSDTTTAAGVFPTSFPATQDGSQQPELIEERRRRARESNAHVVGWGADLDRARRPGVPKERTPPRLDHAPERPLYQQPVRVPVFHSTERGGLTPVFGTSAPPSGVSGRVRSAAYRYSENDLRHWMLLLFADRINVVEGLVSDVAHGHVPNLYREMGGPAEFRYNRAAALRKTAIVAGVATIAFMAWRMRRQARIERGWLED